MQTERGFFHDHHQQPEHQQGKHDDPDPVVGQQHAALELDRAGHPRRVADLAIGGTEDRAHELLQHQTQSPGGKQGFQRPAVQKTDDAAFDGDPERAGHQESGGNGDEQRQVESGRRIQAERFLDHECGVGAEHDHLAVGHVDDAHHAECDRETDGGQQQNRSQAEALEQLAEDIPHGHAAFDEIEGFPRGGTHRGVLFTFLGERPRQQRADFGLRVVTQHADRGEADFRRPAMQQFARGQRAGEARLHRRHGLARQRLLQARYAALLGRLENCIGGLAPFFGILARERQAAKRGANGPTQPVIETNFFELGFGNGGNDRAGQRVLGHVLAVPAFGEHDLPVFFQRIDFALEIVLQQIGDHGIAGGRQRANRLDFLAEALRGETLHQPAKVGRGHRGRHRRERNADERDGYEFTESAKHDHPGNARG